MTADTLLVWIVVGGIAGALADSVVGGIGVGILGAIVVGILGAFVGGWLFGVLGIAPGAGIAGTLLTAFVGAVILLAIFVGVRQRR